LTSPRKLDTMSPWRLLAVLIRVGLGGPESFRSREGLDLWYGPEARL